MTFTCLFFVGSNDFQICITSKSPGGQNRIPSLSGKLGTSHLLLCKSLVTCCKSPPKVNFIRPGSNIGFCCISGRTTKGGQPRGKEGNIFLTSSVFLMADGRKRAQFDVILWLKRSAHLVQPVVLERRVTRGYSTW